MRELRITGPGKLELAEAEPREAGAAQARIAVAACGVCRTDAHLLGGMRLPPGARYPLVPGHEVAGTVVDDVPAVDGAGVRAGERVVAHLLDPCGGCPACVAGHEQRCERADILGIQRPGGLADELVWPARRLVPIGDLPWAEAALLADAGATAYHALRAAALPPGGTLGLIGAGGVGTHLLHLARAADRDVRLAAVVRSAASAARVAALGVHVIEHLAGAAKAAKRAMGSFDAVIDFSGAPDGPAEAVRMLRPGGTLVLGTVTDGDLGLGWITPFVSREITVTGTYTSTIADLRAVVALAAGGRLDLSGTVSHRVPLSDAPHAFDLLEQRPAGMVRAVVEPD